MTRGTLMIAIKIIHKRKMGLYIAYIHFSIMAS